MPRKKSLIWIGIVSGWVRGVVCTAAANPPPPWEEALQIQSRAVEYLRARQNDDGGFPLVMGESDPEVTAWATLALWLAERPARSEASRRGLDFLQKAQSLDGSWDQNTAHTAFAVVTLKWVGGPEEAVQRALQWLAAAQNEDGSWGREPKGPGLTIYTGAALTALSGAGETFTAARQRGLAWLQARQADAGGWPMAEGPPLTLSTSWALLGQIAAGPPASEAALRRGLAWLQQRQTAAGGFAAHAQADQPDPELTAYALLALAAARTAPEAVQRAISYLAATQQPDGGYLSGTPRELQEPAENLQTTSFVAIALAIYQRAFSPG